MFKKILVANRGEIAVRVLRACKEVGIPTVTVYSEADRNALHVRYGDEAYCIGEPPSTESYLKIEKIVDVAKKSGAEAVHPGYGFLAENTLFAKRCEKEGITFIGPSSRAIKLLGDKTAARKTMSKARIPVVPGTEKGLTDEKEAMRIGLKLGFPLMIKAAGGGGGKGMRIVNKKEELKSAIKTAMAEAGSAFGDPRIYFERYLINPRHIEFQILADSYGNVVHLCERECSIQRRHQKMVEESPSCIMTPKLRKEMGEIACKVVLASNYTNAGTVEFLVDKDKNFYFLEMNTRLQVEHPVTELVTGVDIVKEQIHIAAGEKLGLKQKDVSIRGAAIECRISAEDPYNNFMPSTGKIRQHVEPSGPGVRVESGIFEGFDVPILYDPLIAKLLTWGRDRNEAIARMKRALSEYRIHGIKTTIPFHLHVMDNNSFISGKYDTSFVEKLSFEKGVRAQDEIAAIAAVIDATKQQKQVAIQKREKGYNLWKMAGRVGFKRQWHT